jgi:amino acid transporter
MTATKDEPLRRDIGFLGSAFLSFNGMVGAGIFALPGTLYDRFGAFSPFLFPLFGLLVLVVALPFARVAARHPVSGGPVVYAAAFGPAAAFQAGWVYYVARATALAANLTVLVTYLAVLWPPLGEGPARAAIILAVAGLLVWINIVGVKRAVQLIDALTLLKAAPLLFVALMGLVVAGGLLLVAAAVFSLLGNIGGGLTATSRTSYALGRDGLLPGWFGRVHARFATPANSIAFMGALIAILALSGSFVWLAVVSTLARMFVYSISIVSLARPAPVIPAEAGTSGRPAETSPPEVPASAGMTERPGPAVWLMIVPAIAVCVWAAAQSAWPSWRMLLILVAAGTILYAIARRGRR